MTVAFVLGNGESRQPIDLHSMKKYGKVYACNAVYRTHQPDYLVAVDVKMILEINHSKWQMNNPVWTNPNKAYHGFHGFNYFQPSKGWSSGPTALWLASTHGHDTIYILGFDFHGKLDGKGQRTKVNNLYAGTQNYKNTNEPPTYFGNWERQTASTCEAHAGVRYIRVVADEDDFIPKQLKKVSNISHITMSEFKRYYDF
tara:strand:- start:1190 stop:1789 length:600 start_codon:yes stop_codon:yes gene_type:complete